MTPLECKSLTHANSRWSCDYSALFNGGQWHVITGTSGCGKSTLMRLLTGLLTADKGDILVGGKSVALAPPHDRGLSFMSQANALFPGISVFDNLMLALHDDKATPQQKTAKIDQTTSMLKLDGALLKRLPGKLSGGQLSRFNLARALLRPCAWLLLDEPFAAVDRQTRLSILAGLRDWQRTTQAGILLVAHDLDDVFTVATHVTVIANGKIVENAPVEQAIRYPTCLSTALLLRAGLVHLAANGPIFVRPDDLYTAPTDVPCAAEFIESVRLDTAQATRIGGALRIVDLTSGNDVTLVTSGDFAGSLWFDRRLAHPLSAD